MFSIFIKSSVKKAISEYKEESNTISSENDLSLHEIKAKYNIFGTRKIIRDNILYAKTLFSFNNAFIDSRQILIRAIQIEQLAQYILKNYEFVSKISYLKEYLENTVMICDYISIIILLLVENFSLSNDMKNTLKSFLIIFVNEILNQTLEILREITWINEMYFASKKSNSEEKFKDITSKVEDYISSFLKKQKLFIINSSSIIEELILDQKLPIRI